MNTVEYEMIKLYYKHYSIIDKSMIEFGVTLFVIALHIHYCWNTVIRS